MQKLFFTITVKLEMLVATVFPPRVSIQPCKTKLTCNVERDMDFSEWRQYIAKEASNTEYNNIQERREEKDAFMRGIMKSIIESGTL